MMIRAGCNYLELARRLIPSIKNDDVLSYIVWNDTCYPLGSTLQIARQLKAVEKAIKPDEGYRLGDDLIAQIEASRKIDPLHRTKGVI